MKDRVLNNISLIVSLLKECGWDEKAAWFLSAQETLKSVAVDTKAFQSCLEDLDNSIAGMGSFSDLPLKSKTGNRTQQELRNQQWDLAEKLGDEIAALQSENSGNKQ